MDLLLVGLVVALLPVAIARPFFGAVLYTTIAYLRPQNLVGGLAMSARLGLLVLAATVLGLGIAWVRGKERPLLGTPWFVLMLALVGTLGIATQTAVFPDLAVAAWLDFLQTLAGVAITVALCTTPARVRAIVLTAALGLGAMTVIRLVNPVWDAGRLTGGGGIYRDSNDFALALCMALPLLLCGREAVRGAWRTLLLALVPLVLIAIVLTQSRGGFLALSAVLAAWALTTRGRVFKVALAPAAVLAFLALAPAAYLERLTTIRDYAHDSSARDRLSAWKVATRIAEERPLTGVGPGNFLAVYDRYKNDLRRPHMAHNTVLQLLANAGIPAVIAFLLLLLYGIGGAAGVAIRARRARRRLGGFDADEDGRAWVDPLGTGIALALVAYAVGSQFLSHDDMDLFYLLTGLVAALRAHARGLFARRIAAPAMVRGRVVEVPCVSIA